MKAWPALLASLLACQAGAAPLAFDLPRLDGGGRLRLAQFQDRAVVLNFWASNCLLCVRELPLFNALAARQPALPVVGIAIDAPQPARAFLRQHPAAYPHIQAGPGLLSTFGNQINALPYTVIVNSQHQPCARRLGAVDAVWLEAAVAACR